MHAHIHTQPKIQLHIGFFFCFLECELSKNKFLKLEWKIIRSWILCCCFRNSLLWILFLPSFSLIYYYFILFFFLELEEKRNKKNIREKVDPIGLRISSEEL